MALYLGNQKVSLRSGQDPTFDYGFDSNGRLVFANKNATEINNFLNYDSTYSEILDLSNLNKMEKVAVNGTADRRMEGLKGLLVSPNAPFTGSSPQINASYTGLNKSALVSLFESVPYNVGYTKVGNPTIVDGVVSGLDATNKIVTNSNLPTNAFNDCEFCVSLYVPQLAYNIPLSTLRMVRPNTQVAASWFYVRNDRILVYFGANSSNDLGQCSIPITPNNKYKIKIVSKNGDTSFYKSLNDGNFELVSTISGYNAGTFDGPLEFGRAGGSDSDESKKIQVDLNETYIKVNGVPWFGPGVTKNLVPGGTMVGDVTVKDGIASGFSTASHLHLNSAFNPENNPWEMGFKVKVLRVGTDQYFAGRFINESYGLTIGFSSNNLLSLWISGNGTSWNIISGLRSSRIFSLNEEVWIKIGFTGSLYFMEYSLDGSSIYERKEVENTSTIYGGSILLGNSYKPGYFYDGSIDLNNTYIKVGSDYFYRGMVPMTKTCSIVGATGTADLTQEDKNIILSKGWSLTVQ